jgi:hypothetical protein
LGFRLALERAGPAVTRSARATELARVEEVLASALVTVSGWAAAWELATGAGLTP